MEGWHRDTAGEKTQEPYMIDGVHNMQDRESEKICVTGALQEEEIKGALNTTWRMLRLEDALFSLMNESQPQPSFEDLKHVLYKCKEQRNRAHILRFHACMCMRGLESQSFIGNHFVSMHVEVGNIQYAQQTFNRLDNQNESSWNSIIIGYIECGNPYHAFNLHDKMQKDGLVYTSAYAFVALLKACAHLKDIKRGIDMHVEVARMELTEKDLYISSTLIDMYAKCGLLAKAQQVFDKLPMHNVVCCTALLAGYAEYGYGEEALHVFEQMQVNNLSPNAITLICSLQACGRMGVIVKGQEIHSELAKKGMLERDHVSSTIIDMYAKCGWLLDAQAVFNKLPIKDSVSYTSLISGYAEHGQGTNAFKFLEQMQADGLSPDSITFVSSLKACDSIRAADKGLEIHAEIARNGMHENNLFLGSMLIDMYAKWGFLARAKEVLDNLELRNSVSWTALIAGYAEHGHDEAAVACFEEMQYDGVLPNSFTLACSMKACGRLGATKKAQELFSEIERKGFLESDPIAGNSLIDIFVSHGMLAKAHQVFDKLPARNRASWNSLIAGYADYSHGEEALKYLEQMQNQGFCPDAITYICSLKACRCIGARDKGQQLHADIARKGLLEENVVVSNTLVDMYARCGELASAHKVFDGLPIRDAVLWNSLISGYAQLGESENVMCNFNTMLKEGVKPDIVTFLILLNECSHASTFGKAQTYIEAMSKEYGLIPTIKHHTCLVAFYGYQDQVGKAVGLSNNLQPDVVMLRSVLSACRNWGNLDIGKQVFEEAVCI